MAFKHLNSRQVTDAQWDHVESLGVRYSHDGSKFNRRIEDMTVDEERGYYLVCTGMNSRNMNHVDRDVYFYAMCLDDNVVNFDMIRSSRGSVKEQSYQENWNVVCLKFSDGWDFSRRDVDEFKQVVTEAFTAESYTKAFLPGEIKVTVVFPENFESEIENR